MSSQASSQKDQANKLREQFEDSYQDFEVNINEIDILNLPPRNEIHANQKGKMNYKIQSPTIRFIIIIIVVGTLLGLAYFII